MLRASREDGDRTAVSEYVRHLAGDEVGVEGAWRDDRDPVGGENLPRVRGEHGDAVARDDAEFVAEEPREGDDAGGERGVREDGRRRRGRATPSSRASTTARAWNAGDREKAKKRARGSR